uniref:Uncharacterized protein n=1 Tax=Aegilops tauschii subsp. strangulata TaxID=200361 RepID=A0A453JLV0_AEGTS
MLVPIICPFCLKARTCLCTLHAWVELILFIFLKCEFVYYRSFFYRQYLRSCYVLSHVLPAVIFSPCSYD